MSIHLGGEQRRNKYGCTVRPNNVLKQRILSVYRNKKKSISSFLQMSYRKSDTEKKKRISQKKERALFFCFFWGLKDRYGCGAISPARARQIISNSSQLLSPYFCFILIVHRVVSFIQGRVVFIHRETSSAEFGRTVVSFVHSFVVQREEKCSYRGLFSVSTWRALSVAASGSSCDKPSPPPWRLSAPPEEKCACRETEAHSRRRSRQCRLPWVG